MQHPGAQSVLVVFQEPEEGLPQVTANRVLQTRRPVLLQFQGARVKGSEAVLPLESVGEATSCLTASGALGAPRLVTTSLRSVRVITWTPLCVPWPLLSLLRPLSLAEGPCTACGILVP